MSLEPASLFSRRSFLVQASSMASAALALHAIVTEPMLAYAAALSVLG